MFPEDKLTVKWINLARKTLPIEALPARVCYLGFGERKAFALKVNELIKTGVTMIADGSEEADLRLDACMTTDSGIGVVRHAQAGYETARKTAEGQGALTSDSIKVPLWWSPVATFGPEGGRQLRRSAHTK